MGGRTELREQLFAIRPRQAERAHVAHTETRHDGRDGGSLLRIADLPEFNRFLRACALRTSQVLNYSDLARDTAIAPNTARKWLGLLQASAIVTLIEPYFGNRTKRLIKAPKLVMRDTGLAAFLAGFRSAKDLAGSALIGAFWESYVFGEIARQAANRGDPAPIHYRRTAGGPEADLVVERSAGALIAIECKCKEHPGASDAAGLRTLEAAEGRRVKEKMIVCRTKATYRLADGTWVLGVGDALRHLEAAR